MRRAGKHVFAGRHDQGPDDLSAELAAYMPPPIFSLGAEILLSRPTGVAVVLSMQSASLSP